MNAKSQRFLEILQELAKLHDAKSHDYARDSDPFSNFSQSTDWGVRPWVGVMLRAGDKIERLKTFARKNKLMNESVQDSLRDIAVYSIIALVELEQEAAVVDLQGT